VFSESYATLKEAVRREKQLKGWSRGKRRLLSQTTRTRFLNWQPAVNLKDLEAKSVDDSSALIA
jgi:hypothetical protein